MSPNFWSPISRLDLEDLCRQIRTGLLRPVLREALRPRTQWWRCEHDDRCKSDHQKSKSAFCLVVSFCTMQQPRQGKASLEASHDPAESPVLLNFPGGGRMIPAAIFLKISGRYRFFSEPVCPVNSKALDLQGLSTDDSDEITAWLPAPRAVLYIQRNHGNALVGKYYTNV